MSRSAAEIVREYGPFPGVDRVHGVTYDGQHVWFAAGDKLNAFDPASGKTLRSIDVAAHAGTAFDGQHLFQLAEDRIQKIDPKTGRVLATIPAPGGGGDSGLAWAEGTLWVGQSRDRKIHQVDPQTRAIRELLVAELDIPRRIQYTHLRTTLTSIACGFEPRGRECDEATTRGAPEPRRRRGVAPTARPQCVDGRGSPDAGAHTGVVFLAGLYRPGSQTESQAVANPPVWSAPHEAQRAPT